MIRAKFTVLEINSSLNLNGGAKVVLTPLYDKTIEEDKQFQRFTPSGRFEMVVDNPAALEQLTLGKKFYLDLTPVEE